ncbi:DUF1830 domain-containing protein [Myxosarcina sp. GI1(2024)]
MKNQNLVERPHVKIKSEKILCLYQNTTSNLQIIKITNPDRFQWEKVVFPGQRLLFESLIQTELNVYSSTQVNVITTNTIPCNNLRVN